MEADGAEKGGAGEPYPAARVSTLFPSKWDMADQEILPRLIPAGFPVLCNYHFARGPLSSGKASPQSTAIFFFLN